jgi:hypothetical protein
MPDAPAQPPPRAFTQGVGTVFQFTGVALFLLFLFACCGSALFSRDWAVQPGWEEIGWRDSSGRVVLSAARALTLAVAVGVVLGMAVAGIGLGLQAEKRPAPWLAVGVSAFGVLFWVVEGVFAAQQLHSIVLSFLSFGLALIFGLLCGLAVAAAREMVKNPPPSGQDLLPRDYQTPFSHLSQDSPEVRLSREIAQRKARLEVERKEVEALERRLKRKLEDQ